MKLYVFIFYAVALFSCTSKDRITKNLQNESTPEVLKVYPTSDTLPENLLRFYVQFSKSMKAVNNLENIKLLDDEGQEVKGAIFNNVYELWDSEQKQLTLILDPARVKTGLVANENLGRALEPGKHFQLLIEKAEDIYGNYTEQMFSKSFFVTKVDTVIPEVEKWNIFPPKSKSKSPLLIEFPQILDRQSLFNRIRIVNSKNKVIAGTTKVAKEEKEWSFIPDQNWKEDIYLVQVNSRLEDPAGNNINGLFDHSMGSLKNNQEGKIYNLEFEVN